MPSHVGASRIDKAYIGAQEVTAVYLGTEKVYPNVTTWERHMPKWPVPEGNEFSSNSNTTVGQKLYYDGTLSPENTLVSVITAGDVFFVYGEYRYCTFQNGPARRFIAYPSKPSSIKGDYIDMVEHIDENAYPVNGILGDYWYVRK